MIKRSSDQRQLKVAGEKKRERKRESEKGED